MGITGLLPFIKGALTKTHISTYEGKRVAVDAYVWLHRGVLTCASELCQNIPTDRFKISLKLDRHLQYCLRQVGLLLHYGVIPVLVFDGGHLPSKRLTESSPHQYVTFLFWFLSL